MADLGTIQFGVHLKDYTDAEADKIKKKLENLSVKLTIDGKNVSVSHTDLIKKQIEDAIKSVSVQSVKIDTSSLKTQMNTALQGVAPQISVTLLKGTLGNDLQAYLNSKTFNISISITQSSAQNAVKTAFANFSVPVNVTVSASAALQQLRQSLANRNVKIGVEPKDVNAFVADIETKLKNKKVKVDVEPNQQHLVQAMKQALQGVSVKAQVKVDVDAQAITNAVQRAINNANFTYSPNGRGGRGNTNANSAASSQRNLGNAYKYAAQGAYQSARASVSLGRSLSTNIRIAGELGTALGNLASIFGIKDLLYGIVQIGGQLENQRIALGAILQDGGKATEMFSKIQSLAVKSPFGIMDLNQYTKQLSAYGIEYNELYETMKRMADISAGVGVDMGRIILAFGQVKAAGFLKGTELRQFTEANIPMVEKLAEKFSLLEKRIVSAGEVYDMISEKKVTFEDVKDVLWGLTDEGGMFNNMQEVLSESLASKWKNLSDAIDVMYGKMADGMIGAGLKSLAEGLTELTKNWQVLIGVIGGASSAYMAYKALVALGSGTEAMGIYKQIVANQQLEKSHLRVAKTYRVLSAAEKGALSSKTAFTTAELRQAAAAGALTKEMVLRLVAMKKISVAQAGHLKQILDITRAEIAHAAAVKKSAIAWGVFKNAMIGVGAALKSLLINPWTWAFAALSAIGSAIMNWKQKSDELKQITKEVQESATGSMQTIGKELDKLRDLDIGRLNDDELKTQIKDLTTLIKNESPHWQSLLADVFKKDADGNFVKTAKEQLDELIKKVKDVYEAKQMLSDNSELFSDALDKTDGWFFNESLTKNLQDYSGEIKDIEDSLKNLGSFYSQIQTAITKAAGANQEFLKESDGKPIQEKVKILNKYKEEFKAFSKELEKTSPRALSVINDYINAISNRLSTEEWEDAASDIKIFTDAVWKPLLDRGYTLSNLDDVAKQFIYDLGQRLVTNAGDINPTTIKDFWTQYLKNFGIKYEEFSVVPDDAYDKDKNKDKPEYDPSKDEVAKLWKKRAEEIDKAVKMYDKWKEIEGKIFAENRVKSHEELGSLFDGSYGFKLDLEDPTSAYEYIQGLLDASKSAQKELKISIGVKAEDSIYKDSKKIFDQLAEELKAQSKKTFAKWDLYKQLFELTGNKEFAKSAFDDTQVWDDATREARKKLEEAMDEQGKDPLTLSFNISDAQAKEVFEGTGGLYEMWKEIKDRIEKNGIDLKVNVADIVKNSKDFDLQIKAVYSELEEKIQALQKSGLAKSLIDRHTAELTREADEKVAKIQFEEFKKSSDWVKVFDDLNRVSNSTLDNMITKVEEFAKQAHLSEEVTKQLVEAMAKLRKEAIERNPFEGFKDAWNRASYWRKYDVNAAYNKQFNDKTGKFEQKLSQEQVDNNLAEANDDLKDSALAVVDKFQAVANAADLLSGIFDGLGIDLGGLKDVLGGIAGGAQSGAGIAAAFGATGPWGAISGAAVGLLSSVFAQHDKALQKEIEASEAREKAIKNMADNLEAALSKNLGGIYSMKMDDETRKELEDLKNAISLSVSGTSIDIGFTYSDETRRKLGEALREDSVYDAQLASLMAQRDELQEQMRLESEKKNVDDGKIADYEQAIKDMDIAIADFARDMADALYGINFKDWASQLSEAIVNAWASGEDAVMAYKDTVDEILRDLGVSIITQKIIAPMLEDTMNEFYKQFGEDNGVITDASMEILTGMYAEAEQAAKATSAYLEALEKMGIDVKNMADESSSGLSKGIQSVTEDTANLVASYLNAVRGDVSVNRTLIEQLVNVSVPRMSMIAEAQLQQLQMVVANTKRNADAADRIYELVNRVVDKGSNKLKV